MVIREVPWKQGTDDSVDVTDTVLGPIVIKDLVGRDRALPGPTRPYQASRPPGTYQASRYPGRAILYSHLGTYRAIYSHLGTYRAI